MFVSNIKRETDMILLATIINVIFSLEKGLYLRIQLAKNSNYMKKSARKLSKLALRKTRNNNNLGKLCY